MIEVIGQRSMRRLAGVSAVGALILTGAHSAGAAAACRADPVITLSNGITLSLYADIYNDPSTIQQVAMGEHGPAGTTAVSAVIPSDDPLAGQGAVCVLC